MLQIATGKLFKHEVGRENRLRGVPYTDNCADFGETGLDSAADRLTAWPANFISAGATLLQIGVVHEAWRLLIMGEQLIYYATHEMEFTLSKRS